MVRRPQTDTAVPYHNQSHDLEAVGQWPIPATTVRQAAEYVLECLTVWDVQAVTVQRPLANAPANWPIRVAKDISSAPYKAPAFELSLSLSISTATVE